jgi:hypothetical protein
MKRILALLVVAGFGAVVAGCASGTERGSKAATTLAGSAHVVRSFSARGILVTGKATIPNVKAGTVISCKGGPTVTVPAGPGGAVGAVAAVRGPAPVTRLDLTRSSNGVTVSCSK